MRLSWLTHTLTYLNKSNSQRYFLYFITLYFLIWIIAPALLSSSVPLDVSEGINWGSEWQWGYYKHPPLSSWVLFAFYQLFGHFGPYLLSQMCVLLTIVLIYNLGKKFMPTAQAALGALLTLTVIYYTYPSLEFNHNIAQFPIWAGLTLVFYNAVTIARYRDWIILGVIGGLGMLTKYSVAFLLIPMAAYLLLPSQWRLLQQPKPWLSALIMMALFSPHLYWLAQHDWLPFAYASGRAHDSNESVALGTHLSWIGFTLSQVVAHIPLLIIMLIIRKQLAWSRLNFRHSAAAAYHLFKPINPASDTIAANTTQFTKFSAIRFLLYLWLAPLFLLIMLSLILGLGLRDMWGMPMWSLSGLLLASMILPNQFTQTKSRLLKYIAIWLSIATVLMITYLAFGHSLRDKPSRMDWPEQALSQQAYSTWHTISSCPLDSVSGDRWLSALVAMNHPLGTQWPSQMISGPAAHSPWMSPPRLQRFGTLVLTQEDNEVDLPLLEAITDLTADNNKLRTLPSDFEYYEGQWTLSWPHHPKAAPLMVQWSAYVPKSCAVAK